MNSKPLKVLVAAAAVVLVVTAAGVWWFFRGDPVDEVSLSQIVVSVEDFGVLELQLILVR